MEIALRATAIYVFLYLLLRILGRRELAELSPFELILLVIVGDLVQQAVTADDTSVTGSVIAVSTIALLTLAMSFATYRWRPAADALEGRPAVVVHRGRVDERALRLHRMTEDEVRGAARQIGVTDLSRVELAVLEPEGKLSFVLTDGRVHAGSPDLDVS